MPVEVTVIITVVNKFLCFAGLQTVCTHVHRGYLTRHKNTSVQNDYCECRLLQMLSDEIFKEHKKYNLQIQHNHK